MSATAPPAGSDGPPQEPSRRLPTRAPGRPAPAGPPLASDITVPAAYPGARPLRDGDPDPSPSPYAGLATRVLAFAADAVVINVVAWFTALIVGLCLSLINLPEGVNEAFAKVGALVALLWTLSYFVFFWTTTGETPGDRLLRIRVVDSLTGYPPRPRKALLRFILLPVSAIPLGLGFGLILVDDRRRALHDVLARTLVLDAVGEDDVPRRHRH